jgi:formiminotetrahydrofolate cyclodeaminase
MSARKLVQLNVEAFVAEVASASPAPGGGSVAALSGAAGAALAAMVCRLTIGKKKYAAVEEEMKVLAAEADKIRSRFVALVDEDTAAFNKVMEAFGLPKETAAQQALRSAAIEEATKEAALVPLECMKHAIDGLAIAKTAAQKGNVNSASDAGVSALMLASALEGAALNVRINLASLRDAEFVTWRSGEVSTLSRTGKAALEEVLATVSAKIDR